MPRGRLSERSILARQKEDRALQIRLGGATFDDIATQVGYATRSGAYGAVQRAMDRLAPAEEAEKLRKLTYWRLERMLLALWQRVTSATSDIKVVDRVLGILQQQRRLMGLDMPVQIEDVTERQVEVLDERGISELAGLADSLIGLSSEDLEFLQGIAGDLGLPAGADSPPPTE